MSKDNNETKGCASTRETRRHTRDGGRVVISPVIPGQPDTPLEQRRLAFADPPYLGCCKLCGHEHNDAGSMPWDRRCWDDIATHVDLIRHLEAHFDGWAYCMTSGSLRHILPATDDVPYRIASWVKPFAAFKRNVRIAYTWEPVLFSPGRDRSKDGAPVGRDHLAESIQLRAGLTGAKPPRFNRWVLDLLGYVDGDEVTDLFPGTGGMARALSEPVIA